MTNSDQNDLFLHTVTGASGRQFGISASAIHNLYNRSLLFPKSVHTDQELNPAITARVTLLGWITRVFRSLPTGVHITEAIDSGSLDPSVASALFRELDAYLRSLGYHARLVHYLPFELLPHREWSHTSDDLMSSIRAFIDSYMEAWWECLNYWQLRSSFTDGDILEDETTGITDPVVAKVGHLIPMLIAKGYLSLSEVAPYANRESSPLPHAVTGVTEGITAMADFAYCNTFASIAPYIGTLDDVQQESESELTRARLQYHLENGEPRSPRAKWQYECAVTEIIRNFGERIARLLLDEKLLLSELTERAVTAYNCNCVRVYLYGLGIYLEHLSRVYMSRTRELFTSCTEFFRKLLELSDDTITDTLDQMCQRLLGLRVINASSLLLFGFVPRKLFTFPGDQPSVPICSAVLMEITEAIASHPTLSMYLYPVIAVIGSHSAGYANRTSDIDGFALVRPGTSPELRECIVSELQKLVEPYGIDRLVDYWVVPGEGYLTLNMSVNPRCFAKYTFVQNLLLSVWAGDVAEIAQLYEQLLMPFFRPETFPLEHLYDALMHAEHSQIHFRLLHKGYARFCAERVGFLGTRLDTIDAPSAFWDPGFRRLATLIFVKQVFMPRMK